MKHYILKNGDRPWDDYGNTFFEGFLIAMNDDYSLVDIHKTERAAPYIPEIYCANPTNIVVSLEVRILFENNNITGIQKRHDTKNTKLVNNERQFWNFNREDTNFYAETGGPINYI